MGPPHLGLWNPWILPKIGSEPARDGPTMGHGLPDVRKCLPITFREFWGTARNLPASQKASKRHFHPRSCLGLFTHKDVTCMSSPWTCFRTPPGVTRRHFWSCLEVLCEFSVDLSIYGCDIHGGEAGNWSPMDTKVQPVHASHLFLLNPVGFPLSKGLQTFQPQGHIIYLIMVLSAG